MLEAAVSIKWPRQSATAVPQGLKMTPSRPSSPLVRDGFGSTPLRWSCKAARLRYHPIAPPLLALLSFPHSAPFSSHPSPCSFPHPLPCPSIPLLSPVMPLYPLTGLGPDQSRCLSH